MNPVPQIREFQDKNVREIIFAAGKMKPSKARFHADPIIAVSLGLMRMRHAGIFERVYVDAGRIVVMVHGCRRVISIERASAMLKAFDGNCAPRKRPAAAEVLLAKARTA